MAHDEASISKENVVLLQLQEFSGTDLPPVTAGLSGAIFLSGGNLYFKGDTTATRLAVI